MGRGGLICPSTLDTLPMETPLIAVTGATRGIGRAIAERFAAAGWRLALCARTPEALEALGESLSARFGAISYALPADLSERGGAERFAQFVLGLPGPLAVLANNAGQFAMGPLHEEPPGLAEAMMAANFYSAYWATQPLARQFARQGFGQIVNICSIASVSPRAGGGSYFVAKHALYGYTRVLREDLRPYGVKVAAVLPSATLTSSWDGVPLPPGRLMRPSDVAEAVWAACQLSPQAQMEEIVLRPQLGDYP
jgi:NAD(P)-dependent dehydrogenase (short-subunit alcohol dehydrogenase family)